jgi:hypothetical protein
MRHATVLSAALRVYRGLVWIEAATIAPPTIRAATIKILSLM